MTQKLTYNLNIKSNNSSKLLKLGQYYDNFALKLKFKDMKSKSLVKSIPVLYKSLSYSSYFLYIEIPFIKGKRYLLNRESSFSNKLLNNSLLIEKYFFADILCENLIWFNFGLKEINLKILREEKKIAFALLIWIKSKNNYPKKVIRLFINSLFSSFYISNNLRLKFFRTQKEFITYKRNFVFKGQMQI